MSDWKPIETAPRDGSPVMLYHKHHGQIQGWFSHGEWTEDTPISPAEYDGAVWVLGDDLAQEEVEEFGLDAPCGPYHDGAITHWKELDAVPTANPESIEKEE